MIALPSLLVAPAEAAGIKVPADLIHYNPKEFTHWDVYCAMQLGQPMPDSMAHWRNARVIACIPYERIQEISCEEIMKMGFAVGESRMRN